MSLIMKILFGLVTHDDLREHIFKDRNAKMFDCTTNITIFLPVASRTQRTLVRLS